MQIKYPEYHYSWIFVFHTRAQTPEYRKEHSLRWHSNFDFTFYWNHYSQYSWNFWFSAFSCSREKTTKSLYLTFFRSQFFSTPKKNKIVNDYSKLFIPLGFLLEKNLFHINYANRIEWWKIDILKSDVKKTRQILTFVKKKCRWFNVAVCWTIQSIWYRWFFVSFTN